MIDRIRVGEVEASGRAALPALHETRTAGWLLRVSGGDTKRVNSANSLAPDAAVNDVRSAAERLYAAHGVPCRFRLTPLAHHHADAALADAGYEAIDPSFTMVAPLARGRADPALRFADRPSPDWLERTAPLYGRSPAAAAVQARLLAGIPGPIALALLNEGAGPIASGYASIGEGRAQLSDIIVASAARRRGVGRRLVTGLLAWAEAQGCREAMLQVLAGNTVARRLYASIGFVDAYPYHYRVKP